MDQCLAGADLVERGLSDLAEGAETIEALLVSIGVARLRGLGVVVSGALPNPERRLYETLASEVSFRARVEQLATLDDDGTVT